jgi:hypothetical protein
MKNKIDWVFCFFAQPKTNGLILFFFFFFFFFFFSKILILRCCLSNHESLEMITKAEKTKNKRRLITSSE